MARQQDSNWYEFTTFVRRPSNASEFGITIARYRNSAIYIRHINPQNGCPDLRQSDIILSINDVNLIPSDPNVHDFVVNLFRNTPQDGTLQLRVRRFLPMNQLEVVLIKLLPHDTQFGIRVTSSTNIDGQGLCITKIVPDGAAHRTNRLIEGDHILEVHYSSDDKMKVNLRWMDHNESINVIRQSYKDNQIILLVKHQHSAATPA